MFKIEVEGGRLSITVDRDGLRAVVYLWYSDAEEEIELLPGENKATYKDVIDTVIVYNKHNHEIASWGKYTDFDGPGGDGD